MGTSSSDLTVLALGSIDAPALGSLAGGIASLEVIDVGVPSRASLLDHSAALNRAIDGARSDWLLILRAGEAVSPALGAEIVALVDSSPRSWAFRIGVEPWYDGGALHLGEDSEREIRLFHRRHCRFGVRDGAREMKVQGGVVRLRESLRALTFETSADHERYLSERGVPHSLVRRCLLFTANWARNGILRTGARERRYLWIEAGWDSSGRRRALEPRQPES